MTRLNVDISKPGPRAPLWRDLVKVAIPAAIFLLTLFAYTSRQVSVGSMTSQQYSVTKLGE